MRTLFHRFILGKIATTIAFSSGLLIAVESAQAQYIVQNAKLVQVGNTVSNGDEFRIFVTNGTGSCNDKYITFPLTAAKTRDNHQRAYDAALAAFNSNDPNVKVDVFDYSNSSPSSCTNASFIEIKK